MPTILPTITTGELLQVVSFLIAVFAAYNRISMKLAQIETKLDPLWKQYTGQFNHMGD